MQRTRTVGNGEGSLYFSESQQKLIFQYVYNGKKKAIKQKKNELVRDFKARARKLKNELDNGTYIESSNITIYELGKQILDNKLNRNLIIPNTYTTSIQILDVIKKEIGNIKIQKATSFQLQDFIDSTTNYSNNYIGKIYAHLNAIFVEAMKQDLIIKNPMMKVDKVKSKKTDNKIESLTIEEQKKLLEQLKKEKALKPIFTIALYTGMRMGEILALEVNDIDFKNKEIHIQRTLTKNKNDKTILGTTTKTYAGNRIIPITSLFEKELKNAISNMVINKNSLIFTQPDGKLIPVSNMNGKFKRICANAGLGLKTYIIKRKVVTSKGEKEKIIKSKTSTYNQHMLRHTYATRCIESGVPAEVLQKLLGHKDIQTTINTYTTIFDKFKKEQVDKYVEYIENIT